MILLVDEGNTRAKYAVFDPATQQINMCSMEQLNQIRFERVICASVAQPVLDLANQLCQTYGIVNEPICVETPDRAFGLQIAYQDKRRLGVDRWLAMLAGFTAYQQNCLVIDFGTALTIDAVALIPSQQNNQGVLAQHIGGWILPGYQTSVSSLLQNTHGIALTASSSLSSDLGDSTETCLRNGVVASHVLAVEHGLAQLKQRTDVEPLLLVTGGDGLAYMPIFEQHGLNCIYSADLVMRGLACYTNSLD